MDFKEIKNKTNSLLSEIEPYTHPELISQIREFVQVNELKLAVETICDHVSDENIDKDIDFTIKSKIKELAIALSISDSY